ncbi:MAG: ParB/RepB/Spo0J family partition protein [Halobacteriovoraceae bacterium]|jgi:ParB family transcriptional regulator, chromosome partitioning protein|nr:ParB/RepB/Spo0J family partition protein [Halobacteriovoraceae bacterium]MBT5093859.1 ParB/RepB/Spo0J family partition protein [Halobacteriovoraceae bacterium]
MSKEFAPRVSKRMRKTIDLTDKLGEEFFKESDHKLLQGAKLDEIFLAEIDVKEQVRTKFNDGSIKELAKNIKANGLIQPLVLHRNKYGNLTLVCGERRYRAMSSINMERCPVFILEDKSEQELMAIQFSENSSREALHYIDKADGILNYQRATKASERKITAALGISKSEVHRSLMIAKMPAKLKGAAKEFDIEKYVLLEFTALDTSPVKKKIEKSILGGEITKRAQLKRIIRAGGVIAAGKKIKSPVLPKGLTANAFLKVMDQKTKDMKLDKKTKDMLKNLLDETREIVEL